MDDTTRQALAAILVGLVPPNGSTIGNQSLRERFLEAAKAAGHKNTGSALDVAFWPVPEMGVYLGILQVQERRRIGGGGLIFSKFNRLFASGVGSVTCQTAPLGLNNCAN